MSRQPLRALLEEFGAAAGRVACQVGRGSQQGFFPFYPCCRPTAAESWQWAATISRGVEGDREPAARILPNCREARSVCGWGRHSQSAECSTGGPCDRRSRDVASSPPGCLGCVLRAGGWYISTSVVLRSLVLGGEPRFWQRFYFWPPSLPGDERSGGHRGRLESDEGEEGQKAWLLEAGRQL